MWKSRLFAILCSSVLVTNITAQEADSKKAASEEENKIRFWQAQLPGGAFVVALDRICSVGKHEYIVDGGFVVTEVTIDTVGSVVARFYYGEPYRPDMALASGQAMLDKMQETVETVRERAGANSLDRLVVKNYPTTTHAKTVEFRINRKENLDALFRSVNKAWISGKGFRFTIQAE